LTFSAKSRGCIYNFRTVLEIWCGCILYLVLILIFGFNKRFYDNLLLIFCQFWSGSRNDCVELLNNFCQWIFFDISYIEYSSDIDFTCSTYDREYTWYKLLITVLHGKLQILCFSYSSNIVFHACKRWEVFCLAYIYSPPADANA
jgi:hypothetical protein